MCGVCVGVMFNEMVPLPSQEEKAGGRWLVRNGSSRDRPPSPGSLEPIGLGLACRAALATGQELGEHIEFKCLLITLSISKASHLSHECLLAPYQIIHPPRQLPR